MKKINSNTILKLAFIFCILTTINIASVNASVDPMDYFYVSADSDIDSIPNIGINSSSYVNAIVLDGIPQTIAEEWNDVDESFQLSWEHQFSPVIQGFDYYQVCVYAKVEGFSFAPENISIEVWDEELEIWEDWGIPPYYDQYWQITPEEDYQWFSYYLFQNIYDKITIRFSDHDKIGDNYQNVLHIDSSRIFAFNYELDVREESCDVGWRIITPGSGFIPVVQNPIHLDILAGYTFDVTAKGNTFPEPFIYVGNSSDPNDAVPIMFWGTGTPIYTDQGFMNGTLPVWIWINVPIPDTWGEYNGRYNVTVRFQIPSESDTIQVKFRVWQLQQINRTLPFKYP